MTAVTATADLRAARPKRLAWLSERGMGASVLVAALAAGFGVILVEITAYIGQVLQSDPYIGDSGTLAIVVMILSVLLTAVAMYVAAIVTANTFTTIIAGRTRRIALMRLIGASARSQREEVARQGLAVGVLGALFGLGGGLMLANIGAIVGAQLLGDAAPATFSTLQPMIVLPAVGVALTTWIAAWAGSRRVLDVTPLQAIGGAVERSGDEVAARPRRHIGALVMLIVGAALLATGVMVGLVSPLGVIIAFFGGVLSFTGLAIGAVLVMPPVLRLVGRMFGSGATAKLAAENALRYPERSSRMAIGVVMGVTLVTMFAVALESSKVLMLRQGADADSSFAVMDSFANIMMLLVAVSAVIAAVGLVNLLTIGVVQRKRELGLLRAIGLTGRQVRRMVLLEAAHITIAATLLGLVLGVVYGWIAAQSLLGSVPVLPDFNPAGFVWPVVPWVPVAIIAASTALLTLVAAVTPTRLATRVQPVEALAAE
ncbi:FtsX-like permease family protein [Microbacterium sp. NPDC057659]|uniref:ABC transporter permease n=1 Tax=Microbacterium sp. NPDC057659 TaxID=3346198 RepID=UPI0036727BAC